MYAFDKLLDFLIPRRFAVRRVLISWLADWLMTGIVSDEAAMELFTTSHQNFLTGDMINTHSPCTVVMYGVCTSYVVSALRKLKQP